MTHTKAIYAFFFFLFIVTLTAEKTQSQPSVIDIIPGDPTPKSTITFIASHFVNESVENVTLVVQECTNESCYNESIIKPMIKNDANNYEAMVTLLHDDTTYIQYYVECTSGGVVKQSPVLELEVKAQNSQNKTPAFEFLFIIVGIIIAFSLFAKRKP